MATGKFITFEGVDGAGKSTHIAAFADALRRHGKNVISTREPGGTALGEQLRELLLHQPMHLETEALLMFAARREHLLQVIEPALARGEVVLCDRFTDATFAYQGGGRGFDWAVLSQLEVMVQQRPDQGLCQPELTIWFDLDPALAAARLATARVPDKFEAQPSAFFAAVRAGYARRAEAEPQRFARIDAAADRQTVAEQVLAVLRPWLEAKA